MSVASLQFAARRGLLSRIAKSGLIGDIGHVSCTERRACAGDAGALSARAASVIAEIATILDADVSEVTATNIGGQNASHLQVFVALSGAQGLHYSVSRTAGSEDSDLWVEGTRGAFRTNGRLVQYRKKGWPLFVPITLPVALFGAGRKPSAEHIAAAQRLGVSLEHSIASSANRQAIPADSPGVSSS